MKRMIKVLLLLVFVASGNLAKADGWVWDCVVFADPPISASRQTDMIDAAAEFSATADGSASGGSLTWVGSVSAKAHARPAADWNAVYHYGDTMSAEGGVTSEIYAVYDGNPDFVNGYVSIAVTCDFNGSIKAYSGWWQTWLVDPEFQDSPDIFYATASAGAALRVSPGPPEVGGEVSAQGGTTNNTAASCELNADGYMDTVLNEYEVLNGTFLSVNGQSYHQRSDWSVDVSCSLTYTDTYPMECENGQLYICPSLWAHADANFLLSTRSFGNDKVSSWERVAAYGGAEAGLAGYVTYSIQ